MLTKDQIVHHVPANAKLVNPTYSKQVRSHWAVLVFMILLAIKLAI